MHLFTMFVEKEIVFVGTRNEVRFLVLFLAEDLNHLFTENPDHKQSIETTRSALQAQLGLFTIQTIVFRKDVSEISCSQSR